MNNKSIIPLFDPFPKITVNTLEITETDSYDELLNLIGNHLYINQEFIENLKKRIGTQITRIHIEYPYIDSDYSSTYSSFYSKKHLQKPKQTIRLNLFKNEDFKGFIVLRPSHIGSHIAKGYIAPELLIEEDKAYILKTRFSAHVLGTTYNVDTYPWMEQETDIAVCAHVACWNVIRYFSNKYPNYAQLSINDIIERTPNLNEFGGRKVPSQGLSLTQMLAILNNAGFHPHIFSQGNMAFPIKDVAYSYIESGIPVIAGLKGQESGHAITLIGHGEINTSQIAAINSGRYVSSEFVNSFVAINDNVFPFHKFSAQQHYSNYTLNNLQFLIVPLYEKMFLTYEMIRKRFDQYVQSGGVQIKDGSIIRIYLTSSRSFKKHTRESSDMQENLKAVYLMAPMPKFIWVIDISTKDEYLQNKVSQRLIIDSTAESYDRRPWILIQKEDGVIEKSVNTGYAQKIKGIDSIQSYSIYRNNLHETNKGS